MTIAVLGAGAFGTALAIALARSGKDVILWARDKALVREMQTARTNAKRLPGADLPINIEVTGNIESIIGIETVLLSIPMQQLGAFCDQNTQYLADKTLVACCKGIDLSTGLGPAQTIAAAVPSATPAILTGPSFAHDIAKGLPTALTLACADTSTLTRLQTELTTDALRLYRSGDVVGAELGGALKNVIAIACGTIMGAGLGESARAALITRGFVEMQRLAVAMGADRETLAGLSGFGDLILTCTSEGSRNYRYGLALGRGAAFDPTITVEGAATASACLARADALGIDMPITEAVVGLRDKTLTVHQAIGGLLSRPLKEE